MMSLTPADQQLPDGRMVNGDTDSISGVPNTRVLLLFSDAVIVSSFCGVSVNGKLASEVLSGSGAVTSIIEPLLRFDVSKSVSTMDTAHEFCVSSKARISSISESSAMVALPTVDVVSLRAASKRSCCCCRSSKDGDAEPAVLSSVGGSGGGVGFGGFSSGNGGMFGAINSPSKKQNLIIRHTNVLNKIYRPKHRQCPFRPWSVQAD